MGILKFIGGSVTHFNFATLTGLHSSESYSLVRDLSEINNRGGEEETWEDHNSLSNSITFSLYLS